jgi:gluconolactonase
VKPLLARPITCVVCRTLALAVLLAWESNPAWTQAVPQGTVTAPQAVLERVFAGGEFTEGPAVSPDGRVFFSDLTWASPEKTEAGHLWCYDPRTDSTFVYRSPSNMSNGISFDRIGRMVVAEGNDDGARRISRTDLATGKSEILASRYAEKRLNSPNDLVVDKAGRVFFTDPRYGETAGIEQPVMGVYRLNGDGSLTLLIKDVPMPNGIAIAPDERALYVGCYAEASDAGKGAAFVAAYDLLTDGSARFRKVLITFPDAAGPDGMELDVQGNLYVAIRDEINPRVGVYSPGGAALGMIPLPEVPSNVAFGRNADAKTLYITAGGSLYRTTVQNEGYHAALAD